MITITAAIDLQISSTVQYRREPAEGLCALPFTDQREHKTFTVKDKKKMWEAAIHV